MIRYLALDEVLELHHSILKQSGGMEGVRDFGGLESAIAQPRMGFSLVCNHPFADGNKRIGHASMELFLILNGWELCADVDDQEKTIMGLAASESSREQFTEWVLSHLRQRNR